MSNASSKMWQHFLSWLIFIDVFTFAGGYIILSITETSGAISPLLLAMLITSLNVLAAVKIAKSGIHADMNTFMVKVMGGLGLRLFVMLLVVFAVIFLTEMSILVFIISLFISYICKSVLEIIFILKIKDNPELVHNG